MMGKPLLSRFWQFGCQCPWKPVNRCQTPLWRKFYTGCDSEQEAVERLFAGNCRMVIITKGGNGSCVYTKNAKAQIPSVQVEQVVDTTGAGDSFIGSFLYQLAAEDYSLEQLYTISDDELKRFLDFSAHYAALTIGKKGAVMATMQEMTKRWGCIC